MFNPTLTQPTGDLAVPEHSSGEADDSAAVTISSHELSRLTGVGRERLRTWERRYGYPAPVRSRNGVRRYQVDDVRLVAAISQLASDGVPLDEIKGGARIEAPGTSQAIAMSEINSSDPLIQFTIPPTPMTTSAGVA